MRVVSFYNTNLEHIYFHPVIQIFRYLFKTLNSNIIFTTNSKYNLAIEIDFDYLRLMDS